MPQASLASAPATRRRLFAVARRQVSPTTTAGRTPGRLSRAQSHPDINYRYLAQGGKPLESQSVKSARASRSFRLATPNLSSQCKKHLVNKDVLPNKRRADPLPGYMDAILVSGNFPEAYTLLVIISPNHTKPLPIHYVIGKENFNSTSFAAYIMELISSGWFKHGNTLILDNASIHSGGGDAGNVEDYFWDSVIDGRPLSVLVIFLPTQSPELNPMELDVVQSQVDH
jgi:hypothetical protein